MLSKLRAKIKSKKGDRHCRERHNEQSPPVSIKDQDRIETNADVEVSSKRDAKDDEPSRENLWEVAGKRLDEKDRKALGLEGSFPTTDAIQDVIETTEKKYREYKEGGLKIRKRDGGHINVRDSAKNIILHALEAQDLVKASVSFDPTGHASSAWSIVSIGLTLINNDIERRDDIFQAAEYLAGILSYYAIVDNHYRDRKVESDQGLEDALLEVYTAVLQYAAVVKKAEQESGAARVGKSITALVEQPLKDLKETVEKQGQAVQKWTALTTDLGNTTFRLSGPTQEALLIVTDHRKQAESMLGGIDEAVERLKMIQSHNRSLQDREILDWLSTASYSSSQNDAQDRRQLETGNWFLNLPEYKEWKATPGKICWLHGAGAFFQSSPNHN
ncbi:uncharacterized protein LDX57_008161 [Aspergillus melleus]|uniref:uncharacterized protein n=1 Tax=Aspergillus melleus TaxID=138277 RepID=UPI001E8E3FC5|nr:uncharacterized protein LDX57_008161 [Aspergillus melleus]KAH8430499.1 hypothetical protein LDX57_008161 [Aspergillus melleus]